MVCSYETMSITKWLHFQNVQLPSFEKVHESIIFAQVIRGASLPVTHAAQEFVSTVRKKSLEFQVCVKA